MYGNISFNISGDLGRVHVRGVFEIGGEAMVFANEGIEYIGKVNVGILIASIDTAMLVVEFNCTSDGFSQGETGSFGYDSSEFTPFFFGYVFGNQGVLGFDIGEWAGHASAKKSNVNDLVLKRHK